MSKDLEYDDLEDFDDFMADLFGSYEWEDLTHEDKNEIIEQIFVLMNGYKEEGIEGMELTAKVIDLVKFANSDIPSKWILEIIERHNRQVNYRNKVIEKQSPQVNYPDKMINKNSWFKGRISRKTFLLLHLVPLLTIIAGIVISNFHDADLVNSVSELLLAIWSIAFWIVSIFRFHDLNKSGWYVLALFIPLVNFYFLYELFLTRGTLGDNKYGVDPLYTKGENNHLKFLEEVIENNSMLENEEDYNIYIKERPILDLIIRSSRVAFRDDIFEFISSNKEKLVQSTLGAIPFFMVVVIIVLAFVLKSWLILLGIVAILLAFLFNSPFVPFYQVYFWGLILGAVFAITRESYLLALVAGFGVLASVSLRLIRHFAIELIVRRSYYSLSIYSLMKKYKYF